MIHIALCTDEHYAIACTACITSILENNKKENIFLHILTKSLSVKTKDLLKNISQKYGQTIEFIIISPDHFSHLKISNRFRESIYYRFLIPDLINEKKILYLDSDTIIINDLKDLWETKLDNMACGVIEDQASDDIRIHNRIGIDSPYFNSGVLLINADYWRTNNIEKKLTDFIYKYPDICCYPDQDALNVILKNKVKYLPYRYNFQESLYKTDFTNLFLNRNKWQHILNEKSAVKIIHFTDSIKPWYIECNHPKKDIFLKYLQMSGFRNFKPHHFFNLRIRIIKFFKKAFIFYSACINKSYSFQSNELEKKADR